MHPITFLPALSLNVSPKCHFPCIDKRSKDWLDWKVHITPKTQANDLCSLLFNIIVFVEYPSWALTTADRRPPSWNRITDSTHAPPVGNRIGEPHWYVHQINASNNVVSCNMSSFRMWKTGHIFNRKNYGAFDRGTLIRFLRNILYLKKAIIFFTIFTTYFIFEI
jgi:hypothetical protein